MAINVLLMVCAVGANPLKNVPTIMPRIMAISTWKVRLENKRFMLNKYSVF
jgi:hypothetical protein